MAYSQSFSQPDKDAGWGLIFRLNDLWRDVDVLAKRGDYDGWEIVLDRIYANLLYRNEMVIIEDDDGNIVDLELDEKDIQQYNIVKNKIAFAKRNVILSYQSKSIVEVRKAKLNHYRSLMLYDVWLRKFMQAHQLYLKEFESNPGNALFGGAFKLKNNY